MATYKFTSTKEHVNISNQFRTMMIQITDCLTKVSKNQTISTIDVIYSDSFEQQAITTNNNMTDILKLKFFDYMMKCGGVYPTNESAHRRWAKETWDIICLQRKLVESMISRANEKQARRLRKKVAINMRKVDEFIFDMDVHLLDLEYKNIINNNK
jgi:hypothetical protein